MISILRKKSDDLGILSSALCIIHCIATPFLLVAIPVSSLTSHGSQEWWSWLDILFMGISFVAVYKAAQQSTLKWLQVSLIVSWLLLSFFILNERLEGIEFPVDMVYFPAMGLIALHLINRRHCRCEAGCCEDGRLTNSSWAVDDEKNGAA